MSNAIPLYEETMRRLNSLSSPDCNDNEEYTNTFDITQSVFPNPSGFCDDSGLNSEGNSPASSVDDTEKQKQDKICVNELCLASRNCNDFSKKKIVPEFINSGKAIPEDPFAYLQCSVLSNLTSKDIIKSSAVETRDVRFLSAPVKEDDSEKHQESSEISKNICSSQCSPSSYQCEELKDNHLSITAVVPDSTSTPNQHKVVSNIPVPYLASSLHDNVNCGHSMNKKCSLSNCYVDLGERINYKSKKNLCSLNSSHCLTKSCEIVLLDLIHSKDEKIQSQLTRYQLEKARLKLKKKKQRIRRKKLREKNAITTNKSPAKRSQPNISTSRWLNLWTEGDSQLQTMLNDIHVTRNSVRFIQEMVHYDQ